SRAPPRRVPGPIPRISPMTWSGPPKMECLGPQCASMLLEWLKTRAASPSSPANGKDPAARARQPMLWAAAPYQEEASAIRTGAELGGAIEHLEYGVFRRYQNQLTRAERARLDNSIQNALFKVERYVARLDGPDRDRPEAQVRAIRDGLLEAREHA